MSPTTLLTERYTVKQLLKLPGEGEQAKNMDVIHMARSRDLGGDFSIMEAVVQPKEILAPHLHFYCDQAMYIISGELTLQLGAGKDKIRFKAPAGSYVQKPRNIFHAFWNESDNVVSKYIELSGGDNFEGYIDSRAIISTAQSMATVKHDWGMILNMEETIAIMKEFNLLSIAQTEVDFHGVANIQEKIKDAPDKILTAIKEKLRLPRLSS